MPSSDAAVAPALPAAAPRAFVRRRADSDERKAYALLSPALLTIAAGLGAPLVLLLLYSIWTQDYLTIDTTPTLANYRKILLGPIYWPILIRSLAISGAVALTTLLVAYPVAYFLAFDVRRYKMLWMVAITLPFWSSYLLRVFTWKIILGTNGVVNSGLGWLGLIERPLQFLLYNPFAVFITLVYAWAAFAILPIYVSLDKIDRSLLEAATDLGDTPVERFWRVTLPLSMPGVVAAGVMIFVPTIGDYVTPSLVGGPTGQMIANVIQSQFTKANNWPLGAALSLVAMVLVTILAATFARASRRALERVR